VHSPAPAPRSGTARTRPHLTRTRVLRP
jgi:hypothetical protein